MLRKKSFSRITETNTQTKKTGAKNNKRAAKMSTDEP